VISNKQAKLQMAQLSTIGLFSKNVSHKGTIALIKDFKQRRLKRNFYSTNESDDTLDISDLGCFNFSKLNVKQHEIQNISFTNYLSWLMFYMQRRIWSFHVHFLKLPTVYACELVVHLKR